MNLTHFVINENSLIATIYHDDKLGRVVVFRDSKINIEFPIKICAVNNPEVYPDEDILSMIMKVLPK